MSVIPYVENPTWADGSGGATPDTAAKKNTIEQGITDAHLQPAAHVYHDATQSLTTATETALAFNSERFDVAGGAASTQHDTVTNNSRLTCRFAGKYHVTGNVEFAVNATGQRAIWFRVNGGATQYIGLDRRPGHGSLAVALLASASIDLAVNDYVQVIGYQDSGGGLNVGLSSVLIQQRCEFMWHRVG